MSYYRTPAGVGYAVNFDPWGRRIAIRTADGCSWWSVDEVESIPWAQAVNEWGRG